jgi:response regulator of citrate/malate metabolism
MENKQVSSTKLETLREKTVQHVRLALGARDIAALSTEELAAACKIKPGTIRRALCVKGHFWGLVPRKFPNGRLFWPL